MNRQEKECGTEEGEASSASSGSRPIAESSLNLLSRPRLTPSTTLCTQSDKVSEEAERMKRAAVKKIIERYFYQLTDGCGNPSCKNQFCASSGMLVNLTPDQAAAQAIHLFSTEAQLCEAQPKKVARTQSDVSVKDNENGRCVAESGSIFAGSNSSSMDTPMDVQEECSKTSQSPTSTTSSAQGKAVPFLTEEKLLNILEICKNEGSYALLIRTLGEVYSSIESLSISFLKKIPESPIDAMLDKAPKDLKNIKKEDVRMMEGDMDKDEDSLETGESSLGCGEKVRKTNQSPSDTNVDILSLRRAYKALFDLSCSSQIESPFVHALITLAGCIEFDLRVFGVTRQDNMEDILNVFIIILEIPMLGMTEYLELALPKICKAVALLPLAYQAKLARVWAKHSREQLRTLVQSLQQLITLKVISGHFSREYCIQEEEAITEPTKLMKVAYYASILAGELDSPDLRQEDTTAYSDDDFGGAVGSAKTPRPTIHEDPLGVELGVNVLDSRKPLLPFTDFYNDPLSDAIEMDKDFANYKHEPSIAQIRKFSFMNYSFILTPATKTLGLYYDNRIRMYSERRISFFHQVIGQPTSPYLKVRVKRDDLISDALVELEMIAMESPKDLKKQLVVEFDGEQGIDEGGVSKEFFQLIVEELFNPDYGMFVHQQETETVWFNPTSFESDAQFTLIGIILGLAIYNNVILDIHFPMVIYRKLLGKKGTFHDLEDWNPALYTGLQTMLDYEHDDMEDTFVQTFRICYQDVFGTTYFHELKEGGDQIFVNQDNKQEFVDLYADFLLNSSVDKQFRAFRRGFQMVTDESPLHLLFRPEEVEQLVCGSKNFDFNELEDATEYDGGYTAESEIIKFFWEVVHNLSQGYKRKLLQFATGSDRVPVGGLSKLKLIIARNGPDSERLPTAHTCFNVLLLPEYDSKEKLKDRLLKAISYSKGFGML